MLPERTSVPAPSLVRPWLVNPAMLELIVKSTDAEAESETVMFLLVEVVPNTNEPPEMVAPPLLFAVLATVLNVALLPRVKLSPMLSVGVAPAAELLAPKISPPPEANVPKPTPLARSIVPSEMITAPVELFPMPVRRRVPAPDLVRAAFPIVIFWETVKVFAASAMLNPTAMLLLNFVVRVALRLVNEVPVIRKVPPPKLSAELVPLRLASELMLRVPLVSVVLPV